MKVKTLQRINNSLQWIDQTQLPHLLKYKKTDDYKDIIYAIKRLEIRGAPAIGIAAAYGIAVAVEKISDSSLEFITKVGDEFKSARPTAVNLFWAVSRMLKKVSDSGESKLTEIKKILWEEAKIFIGKMKQCVKISAKTELN